LTLPPAPRGIPQIEVTFDIDANGIVHVAARDKATGKEQSMTITGQSSLAKDDIERMVRDAESHQEDDRRRREEAEVRNTADTLVYQTEKLLREQGDKIEGSEKEAVSGALQGVKDALSGSDIEAIKTATESLMTASQGFSQRLYEQASQSQATDGPGASGSDDHTPPMPPTTRSWTPRSSTRNDLPSRARLPGSPVRSGAQGGWRERKPRRDRQRRVR
jgi:molecular chaperone DnaK